MDTIWHNGTFQFEDGKAKIATPIYFNIYREKEGSGCEDYSSVVLSSPQFFGPRGDSPVDLNLNLREWNCHTYLEVSSRQNITDLVDMLEGQASDLTGLMINILVKSDAISSYYGLFRNFFYINRLGAVIPYHSFSSPIPAIRAKHTGSFTGSLFFTSPHTIPFFLVVLLHGVFLFYEFRIWILEKGEYGKIFFFNFWFIMKIVQGLFLAALFVLKIIWMIEGISFEDGSYSDWRVGMRVMVVSISYSVCALSFMLLQIVHIFQYSRVFQSLAIVNSTLRHSKKSLAIFLVIFVSVVLIYASIMHFVAGHLGEQFATVGDSIGGALKVISSGVPDSSLSFGLDPTMGINSIIVYWSYVFFVVYILVNL